MIGTGAGIVTGVTAANLDGRWPQGYAKATKHGHGLATVARSLRTSPAKPPGASSIIAMRTSP